MMDKVKADLKEEICVIIRGKIAQAVVVVATAITNGKISKISVADTNCAKIFFLID